MILYHLNGGNLVVRPCARVLLKQAYQPQSTHSSRNSPFVKRWADVETPTRPGQEQEQASGTMRRSGSPDQSRSRKKLRPCHGQPGPALGVTPDPRRRRRLGRGGEGKKFSLTPETAPADAHHGLAEETCSREGPIFNALAARYRKEARYRSLPAAGVVVEGTRQASVRHHDSLSIQGPTRPASRLVQLVPLRHVLCSHRACN